MRRAGLVGRSRRAASRVRALARISTAPLRVAALYGLAKISRRAAMQPCPFRPGGVDLWARPHDWLGLDEVFTQQEYAFVADLLAGTRDPIIVDLGANVGAFAAFVLARWPSASVFSVEASADTASILKRNTMLNPQLRWTAHHYALWTHDGYVDFQTTGVSTGRRVQASGGGVTVPSITLPSLLSRFNLDGRRIALLKMDIEGAEQGVLAQAGAWMDRIDHLVVEIHPPASSHDAVLDRLRASFPVIRQISRASTKPLVVASR